MSEESKPQELEDEQPPAPDQLSEYLLNEIAGGTGGNPVLPHGGPVGPGG
jgi:hypothetical protein